MPVLWLPGEIVRDVLPPPTEVLSEVERENLSHRFAEHINFNQGGENNFNQGGENNFNQGGENNFNQGGENESRGASAPPATLTSQHEGWAYIVN